MKTKILSIVCGLVAVVGPVYRAAAVTAIKLPDGAIKIDARDSDWHRAGDEALKRAAAVTTKDGWMLIDADRGTYNNDSDVSYEAWLAHDSANFYVLANVRDDFLTHDGDLQHLWYGDDFEVFIDAGPDGTRLVTQSPDCHQIIVVPGRFDLRWAEDFLTDADRAAGVEVATRLRPGGYTIEMKIPKAIVPNWKAHPDLGVIGFDLQVSDADAPGVDAHHPILKGAQFLFKQGQHFRTPENLTDLKLEAEAVTLGPEPEADAKLNDDQVLDGLRNNTPELAQAVWDSVNSSQAGAIAGLAIKSADKNVVVAGMFILAQRPDLDADTDALASLLTESRPKVGRMFDPAVQLDHATRQYAMMALARRHKLPAKKIFNGYGTSEELQIKLTTLWCCGINGDREVTPRLISALQDDSYRVRMMAALALGELKDPAATKALTAIMKGDKNGDAQLQAKQSLDLIGAGTEEKDEK